MNVGGASHLSRPPISLPSRVRVGTSILASLIVIPALVSTLAWGEGFADSSAPPFRVTWEPRTYAMRPSIEGYVHNDSPYWVSNVRLRIEGLDAGQRTIGERYVWTLGRVLPSNRVYFMAESLPGAASYRITVASYDLMTGGQ
jgi:hypothetical protein